MARGLKGLFELHIEQLSRNPHIDVDKVRSVRYLHEFDRELQGPIWGYPTEGSYCTTSCSASEGTKKRSLLTADVNQIEMPLLIAVHEAIPHQEFRQNPFTVMCVTNLGGHIGWFESGGGRWFAKTATQFFTTMARRVDLTSYRSQRRHPPGKISSPLGGDVSFDPMRRRARYQR
ncbi:MAG: hypothetical protein Q9188_004488 [Gyalolechia gomerana]